MRNGIDGARNLISFSFELHLMRDVTGSQKIPEVVPCPYLTLCNDHAKPICKGRDGISVIKYPFLRGSPYGLSTSSLRHFLTLLFSGIILHNSLSLSVWTVSNAPESAPTRSASSVRTDVLEERSALERWGVLLSRTWTSWSLTELTFVMCNSLFRYCNNTRLLPLLRLLASSPLIYPRLLPH